MLVQCTVLVHVLYNIYVDCRYMHLKINIEITVSILYTYTDA